MNHEIDIKRKYNYSLSNLAEKRLTTPSLLRLISLQLVFGSNLFPKRQFPRCINSKKVEKLG